MLNIVCEALITITDIRIGFENASYTFVEPQEARNVTVTLEKQDGRISEQTFLVTIEASSNTPNASISPATISTLNGDGSVSNNDYSISAPGENTVLLVFGPGNQTLDFEFTLYPDNVTESLEGFQIQRIRTNFLGPPFLPPTSGALFSSSFIIIDERKLHTFRPVKVTIILT